MGLGILIALGVIVVVVFYLISVFNRITKSRNQIENSISALDASYIKRSDLIPNLVATVKQYMAYEESTLEKITAMRETKSLTNPEIENEGGKALKNLMIQVESYPELKANTQFTNLQYSWNEAEEHIAAGRRYISSSITYYNDNIAVFPANLLAPMLGFSKYEWQYASKKQQENIRATDLFK